MIVDQEGTLPCYEVQDILMRRDKTWKVTQVLIEQSDSGPNTLPTLYGLTDQV